MFINERDRLVFRPFVAPTKGFECFRCEKMKNKNLPATDNLAT